MEKFIYLISSNSLWVDSLMPLFIFMSMVIFLWQIGALSLLKYLRSGGGWLLICGTIYLSVGIPDVYYHYLTPTEQVMLDPGWLFALSLPLWFRPLAGWLNMKPFSPFK